MAAITLDRLQILEVAGVGERVEVDERFVAGGEPIENR
jgi:hypothetical protein